MQGLLWSGHADCLRYSFSAGLMRALCHVGLNTTRVAAGNLARFQLVFKLTSDVNPNYLHIHTLKGLAVASRVCFSSRPFLPAHDLLYDLQMQ